jgi:formiminotetrahydrofolate cyclodeaminase
MAGRFPRRSTFLELPLGEFLDEVASPELVPGAGFSSAVTVAMAAGLVTMTARRSLEVWPEGAGAAAQAERLRKRVIPLAEENVEAYRRAVGLLHGSELADGRNRDFELSQSLEEAARIPLQIGEAAADVAALAADVAEYGEPSVRADAATAGALALAGARGAAILVEVNLTTTSGDERLARARELVADAESALERASAQVG